MVGVKGLGDFLRILDVLVRKEEREELVGILENIVLSRWSRIF